LERSPVSASRPWHAWEVPYVGIRTRFESNAEQVIALARNALEPWRASTGFSPAGWEPLVVRIEVEEDGAASGPWSRAVLRYQVEGHRLTISGPGVHAVAELETRRADARVSSRVVDDAEHFRYGVLESLALFVISRLDRQPLHAAAVARDDAVILLVGPAGVGKSTLTYAALRAGFRVFAEDIVWLQLRPELRVWGLASRIHLPGDAGRAFPELAGRTPVLVAAGESKLVVPIETHQRPDEPHTRTTTVCLVERWEGAAASLRRVEPGVVRRQLAPSEPGFGVFADTIGPALDALAAPGGWQLTLSSEPAEAIPLLERIVAANETRRA